MRIGDRADQPVASERHRELAAFGGTVGEFRACSRLRVRLDVVLEPELGQCRADVVEHRRGPTATRLRVDDQRQHQPPVTSA